MDKESWKEIKRKNNIIKIKYIQSKRSKNKYTLWLTEEIREQKRHKKVLENQEIPNLWDGPDKNKDKDKG